jgi:hypothetical protein
VLVKGERFIVIDSPDHRRREVVYTITVNIVLLSKFVLLIDGEIRDTPELACELS